MNNDDNDVDIDYQMKVTMKNSDHKCKYLKDDAFQIGVICVPRNISNNYNNTNNKLEHIVWLNKFQKIYQNIEEFPNDCFGLGNISHRRGNNGNKILDELNVHYLMPYANGNKDDCISEICWKVGGYITCDQDTRFDCTNKNDYICVGIHCINDGHGVYFIKNDEIIVGNEIHSRNTTPKILPIKKRCL